MKRGGFVASIVGVLASLGLPLKGLAQRQTPRMLVFPPNIETTASELLQTSMRPLLPKGVIVRWERWRVWTAGNERHATWALRFTTCAPQIADEMQAQADAQPYRMFLDHTQVSRDGSREILARSFVFCTFAFTAHGHRQVTQLRRAVRTGELVPAFRVEGQPALSGVLVESHERPFIQTLQRMVDCCEHAYALENPNGDSIALKKFYGFPLPELLKDS